LTLSIIGIFILSLCFAATDSGAGKLYTWTDGKGALHITDKPPPGSATTIRVMEYKPAETPLETDGKTGPKPPEGSPMDQEEGKEAQPSKAAEKARQEALKAIAEAEDAARREKELLNRLGRNKKMQRRNRYKLRKAAEYTKAAEAEARSAEIRAAKIEQNGGD